MAVGNRFTARNIRHDKALAKISCVWIKVGLQYIFSTTCINITNWFVMINIHKLISRKYLSHMYNTRFIQILKIMTWRRQWEGDTKTHTGTSFEVKLNDYKSPTGNISYIVCGIHTAQHERHFYNKIPTYWYTVSLYRYLWVTFLCISSS